MAVLYCFCSSAVRTSPRTGGGDAGAGGVTGFGSAGAGAAGAAADAEFGRNACEGARENAKKAGLRITYDRNYPPNTTDFAPIVEAFARTARTLASATSS